MSIKLEIALRKDGVLVLLLPGAEGTQREVPVGDEYCGPGARMILQAQAQGEVEIGEDGAPTSAQLKHWEKHQDWPQQNCRFCIAEGRAQAHRAAGQARFRVVDSRPDGTVIRVKRLTEKGKRDINLRELFDLEEPGT